MSGVSVRSRSYRRAINIKIDTQCCSCSLGEDVADFHVKGALVQGHYSCFLQKRSIMFSPGCLLCELLVRVMSVLGRVHVH